MKRGLILALVGTGILLVLLTFWLKGGAISGTSGIGSPAVLPSPQRVEPSIDPNFGPGFPTFNPEDPSTFWLSPQNRPENQMTQIPGQELPPGGPSGIPSQGAQPGLTGENNAQLCNSSITAASTEGGHQVLVEARVKDLNKFTFVRVSWGDGGEVMGIEFLNGYGRNGFFYPGEVPKSARVEVYGNPDFTQESLICGQKTVIEKVR
jgi:hypothetical protein